MPLFLVRLRGLFVAALVVTDDLTRVPQLRDAPPTAEYHCTAVVERSAHLLRRHLGIFPPATAACEWPRTRGRVRPRADDASTRYSPVPRSASGRPPVWPGGTPAPPSNVGKRPSAPASATDPSRWSGSTSPRRSPR